MCTEDLYLCKDSSRINCTLACSTLGYIPCKNYMDRKICATVNKKASKFYSLKTNNKLYHNLFNFDTKNANSNKQHRTWHIGNSVIVFNDTLFYLGK